jgi:5-bromo-4-chloroindolyl phosphate hydrolysis protein
MPIKSQIDPWKAEKKSTFPIKKMDIVKKIKLTDGIEIRRQIDKVIDNKPEAHYSYDQSLFRYMDRTVSFEGRLN